MSTALDKKSILKKTVQVASSTLLSRFFGIIRVFLLGRFLGSGALADTFFTAFTIPNSFRKIFAEGALSAAFTPKLVALIRKDKDQAHSLLSLGFIVFEGLVLLLCVFVILKAHFVLNLIVPGFSSEQIDRAVPLLRILMPFILFLSSSALLAGALQAIGHFFIPAFSPVLLNIVFIIGLLTCLTFGLSVEVLCFFILLGGLLQFIAHLITYTRLHFAFGPINRTAWKNLGSVLIKFIPCFICMSFVEMSLVIDKMFASYLPPGSISSIQYAHRFMGIPLGVFAVAFSTILLPHFSRISIYAPSRLSFYLLESTKFVFWVTIPVACVMSFFAFNIFETLFLSKNFSLEHVVVAQWVLSAFLLGLFSFSLNKILLIMFYALQVTWIPTIVSLVALIANIGANAIFVMWWQAPGLAFATALSGILQTLMYVYFLKTYFKFHFYWANASIFFVRYVVQLVVVLTTFYYTYQACAWTVARYAGTWANFFLHSFGFWVWVAPLVGLLFLVLFFTRTLFGVRLYFLS